MGKKGLTLIIKFGRKGLIALIPWIDCVGANQTAIGLWRLMS
jgi:hypothetical protein